jgi:hypothetical protein
LEDGGHSPTQVASKKRSKYEGQQDTKKFFTLKEDFTILAHYKKSKGKKDFTMAKCSEELEGKLEERTAEAIRDRLKSYLANLSKQDEEKITKNALVVPSLRSRKAQDITYILRRPPKAIRITGPSETSLRSCQGYLNTTSQDPPPGGLPN